MKYSALITYFNSPNPAEAIQSALSQSLTPEEIIVVDDFSDIQYQVLLQEAAKLYGCLYLRTEGNLGPAGARNLGVRNSKCDFIIVLDDDDVSLPDRAKVQINELHRGSHLCYVSSRKLYPNHYFTEAINETHFGVIDPVDFGKYLLSGENRGRVSKVYVPACTLAFDKRMFDLNTPFDESFRRLEDVDFALCASKNRLVFSFISFIGVERKASQGVDKTSQLEYEAQVKVLSKHSALLEDNEYKKMVMWSQLRADYFSRRYLRVLLVGGIFFLRFGLDSTKVRNAIFRIIHDSRKDF